MLTRDFLSKHKKVKLWWEGFGMIGTVKLFACNFSIAAQTYFHPRSVVKEEANGGFGRLRQGRKSVKCVHTHRPNPSPAFFTISCFFMTSPLHLGANVLNGYSLTLIEYVFFSYLPDGRQMRSNINEILGTTGSLLFPQVSTIIANGWSTKAMESCKLL